MGGPGYPTVLLAQSLLGGLPGPWRLAPFGATRPRIQVDSHALSSAVGWRRQVVAEQGRQARAKILR